MLSACVLMLCVRVCAVSDALDSAVKRRMLVWAVAGFTMDAQGQPGEVQRCVCLHAERACDHIESPLCVSGLVS